MGPTCVVLGNLNSNAYQINTYGPHMGPICVVLGNSNSNAYQINTYGPHMGPICVVLGNSNSNAYQINTYGPHIPGSKTDGTHMGFIWAGWGPYAPHGNHMGPIWAIRIVMHTRSTHMGPTWVPYVFWAICPELHIWAPHGTHVGYTTSDGTAQMDPKCTQMCFNDMVIGN